MTASLHENRELRSAVLPSGRILAIDYGRRRLGLAVSDKLAMTARPLPALARKNRRDDLRRLRDLARGEDVSLIVVGLPVHLDGRAGEMAQEATRFAERIEKELGLLVALRDERLTSWEAGELRKQGSKSKPEKGEIDSIAAAVLLREFLDERRKHGNKQPADGE
jgi:putative Holliday junction resolvase